MPSSPFSSSTATPLDCFATTIKIIMEAAKLDPRVAPLVPKVADSFAIAANDPKAKKEFAPHKEPDSSDEGTKIDASVTSYLVEALRVLSLCAPVFPTDVNELISLIIKQMSDCTKPSGFALTEVSAETQMVSADQNIDDIVDGDDGKTNHTKQGEPELAAKITRKDRKWSERASSPDKMLEGRFTFRFNSVNPNGRESPRAQQTIAQPSFEACNDSASNYVAIDRKKSDIPDSAISVSSDSGMDDQRKRKSTDDGMNRVSDRIPKRPKNRGGAWNQVKVHAPRSDGGASYAAMKKYRSLARPSPSTDHYGPFSNYQDRNVHYSSRENHFSQYNGEEQAEETIREDICFSVVLHWHKLWKRFLEYKPTTKCRPTDTYLVIVVIHEGSSNNWPFLLKKYHKEPLCDEEVKSFLGIKKIVLIPRPLGDSEMYYCISNLHVYQHGSLHLKSPQDLWFKEATKHISDVDVIEPGHNYENFEFGIRVQYRDPSVTSLSSLRQLIPSIANAMDPASTGTTARKVPGISHGWTVNNPNEYKNNQWNMLGSIRPSITNGKISGLHPDDKNSIVSLVCEVIKEFSPCGIRETPFFHSDPAIRATRSHFARILRKSLGSTTNDLKPYFLAEGFVFIFSNFVPFHVDTMNDKASPMNHTLAVNCLFTITSELTWIPSIAKAMEVFHLNTGDTLSFSLVIYSRKCIADFVKWKLRVDNIIEPVPGNESKLPTNYWLIGPLLQAIERVDSEVNSNALWDKPELFGLYMGRVDRDVDSDQYQGDFIPLVAGFDKMRYWSPIKYLFDALHVRNIITWDRDNAMGFVCFVSFEMNGTYLLSGILDEVLCTDTPSETLFMKEVETYGVYPALIFAGYRLNNVASYGSSCYARNLYNDRGSSKTIPIAGGKGLVTCENDADKKSIAEHCNNVIARIINVCEELHRRYRVEGIAKPRGIPQECIDRQMNYLLNNVQPIAGPGVGHVELMNFIQVASLLGLLPYESVGWARVNDVHCDAFKAIKMFHEKKCLESLKEMNETDASLDFTSAVRWISSNINWNFSHAMAENILVTELYNEHRFINSTGNVRSSTNRDVLYLYKHWEGKPHPLYRWKTDTRGIATLEAMLPSKENISGKVHCIYRTCCMGGRAADRGHSAYWSHTMVQGNDFPSPLSKYIVEEKYSEILL